MGWLKSLLGIEPVVTTATKLIDKLAGTDFTDKEKAQWILDYHDKTKHQSPMRRIIACSITFMWMILGLCWFVSSIIGRFYYDEVINPGTALAADVSAFMSLNINEGFALLLAFYFASGILSHLKK